MASDLVIKHTKNVLGPTSLDDYKKGTLFNFPIVVLVTDHNDPVSIIDRTKTIRTFPLQSKIYKLQSEDLTGAFAIYSRKKNDTEKECVHLLASDGRNDNAQKELQLYMALREETKQTLSGCSCGRLLIGAWSVTFPENTETIYFLYSRLPMSLFEFANTNLNNDECGKPCLLTLWLEICKSLHRCFYRYGISVGKVTPNNIRLEWTKEGNINSCDMKSSAKNSTGLQVDFINLKIRKTTQLKDDIRSLGLLFIALLKKLNDAAVPLLEIINETETIAWFKKQDQDSSTWKVLNNAIGDNEAYGIEQLIEELRNSCSQHEGCRETKCPG